PRRADATEPPPSPARSGTGCPCAFCGRPATSTVSPCRAAPDRAPGRAAVQRAQARGAAAREPVGAGGWGSVSAVRHAAPCADQEEEGTDVAFRAVHQQWGTVFAHLPDLGCGRDWEAVWRVRPPAPLVCDECRHPVHAKLSPNKLRFFAHAP